MEVCPQHCKPGRKASPVIMKRPPPPLECKYFMCQYALQASTTRLLLSSLYRERYKFLFGGFGGRVRSGSVCACVTRVRNYGEIAHFF